MEIRHNIILLYIKAMELVKVVFIVISVFIYALLSVGQLTAERPGAAVQPSENNVDDTKQVIFVLLFYAAG